MTRLLQYTDMHLWFQTHIFLGFVGFGKLTKHLSIATKACTYNNRKDKSGTKTGPDSLRFWNARKRNLDFIEFKLGFMETFQT